MGETSANHSVYLLISSSLIVIEFVEELSVGFGGKFTRFVNLSHSELVTSRLDLQDKTSITKPSVGEMFVCE